MTQSNSHLHHRRTPSSNGSKVRTSRPTLHRKGTYSVNHPISKLGSGQVRRPEPESDRQPDMAASFLNFCAMCERQITVPDNSLLYCSESCRRKDSHKPLSASFPSSGSIPYLRSPPTSPLVSSRMIVAPMTPTKAPLKSTPTTGISTDVHDSKVDQDPSEWKPVIPAAYGSTGSLASTEAWHYLSQFHGSEPLFPRRRDGAGHRSSASLSTLMSATAPVPSLTHTPSTTASSFSSTASDYIGYIPESSHRPLPPRHNPYFSNGAGVTKSVELVVPHVETPSMHANAVDLSDSGSIFPASSSLWNESLAGKTPTEAVTKAPSALDLPIMLKQETS
ncbi:hypothetical protein LV164_001987 [Aspergillus fumigatus]|nr:hypothetical protein KXX42_001039 [Aspergillus fumigatus]KAH1986938.1 hypothetical protein KXW88_005508 [Aspergillus fumigatus]KAH2320500.1 hypothetical protein KXV47_000032 [Aspergillus fumigatus]KAH2675448.1 hypothetical protein KXV32_003509 [Aspergillus fumigatus]KAH2767164.1 hypothetical protein KXV94_002085 [Aspergillus fumigatus]